MTARQIEYGHDFSDDADMYTLSSIHLGISTHRETALSISWQLIDACSKVIHCPPLLMLDLSLRVSNNSSDTFYCFARHLV